MNNKLQFIVFLRALSVLAVVYSHLFQVVVFYPVAIISEYVGAMPYDILRGTFSAFWTRAFLFPHGFGQIGVGLFFFISGFLIPISLEKTGSKKFLINRLFRLYPTYIACVLFAGLVVYAYTLLTPFNFSNYHFNLGKVLLAPLGVHNKFGLMGGVLWTLIIEWQFYLLSAIVFAALIKKYKKIQTPHLILLIIIAKIAVIHAHQIDVAFLPQFFLLLIGTVFFYITKKGLNLEFTNFLHGVRCCFT